MSLSRLTRTRFKIHVFILTRLLKMILRLINVSTLRVLMNVKSVGYAVRAARYDCRCVSISCHASFVGSLARTYQTVSFHPNVTGFF